MIQLGKVNRLVILRGSDHGYYLDGGDYGDVLLPTAEAGEMGELEPGDEMDVFLSRDSADRILATRRVPICEVGDFASLLVKSVNSRIGAFLDWGMAKDLLLPFGEQLRRVNTGDRVVVYVKIDERSDRIVATMKTKPYLNLQRPAYEMGDAVSLMIEERSPLGFNAIVDGKFRGLIHENVIHRPVRLGEVMEGYVSQVHPDDKLDLSLEQIGYGRITNLSERILAKLDEHDGELLLNDKSPPETIRRAFGVSKKAFKQAVGALYRQRKIALTDGGIRLVKSK